MKKLFILTFIFLSATLLGQINNRDNTLSLLKWLIQKDHIQYLNAKSNAAVFYDKNVLTKQTLITDSGKIVTNVSLKDFLSPEEIQTCKTVPPMLEQTDWRIKYSQLKIKFVTDKSAMYKKSGYTIYAFSQPIFLNKENSRVIIGEYFFCGMVCGRVDLLLCQFKNGNWHLLARVVLSSD